MATEIEAILVSGQSFSPAVPECIEALRRDEVALTDASDSGSMTARDALATYGIRRNTARAGGIDTSGFQETLASLSTLPEDQRLHLYGLKSAQNLFVVFIRTVDSGLVGCLRLSRRAASQ